MFFNIKRAVLIVLLASISSCAVASTWSDIKKQCNRLMSEPVKTGLFYCKIALEGAGTVIAGYMAWDEIWVLVDKIRTEKIKLAQTQLHGQLKQILIIGGLGLITHKCLKSFINDVKKL